MVEKPIKRSERAAQSNAEDQSETQAPRESRGDRSNRRGDRKGQGRGKGRGDRKDAPPPVPLAFVRGPKPQRKVAEPEPEVTEVGTEAEDIEAGDTETVTPDVSEEPSADA